jgi:hypothetical protein
MRSQNIPNTPSGASQMSLELRHLYVAEQTTLPLGSNPLGYVGFPLASEDGGRLGMRPAASDAFKAAAHAAGMDAATGVLVGYALDHAVTGLNSTHNS